MGELINEIRQSRSGGSAAASGLTYKPEGNVLARVGAGLVNTVKDAILGMYALPDIAHDLYDIIGKGQLPPEGREHLPGARAAQDWIISSDEWVRDALGLPPVDPIENLNVTDTLLENVPGVFLPFGAAAKAAKLGQAPKLIQRAASLASTVAGTPVTTKGKLLAGAAIGGIDTALLNYLDSAQQGQPLPDTRNEHGYNSIIAEIQAQRNPSVQSVVPTRRNSIISEILADREVEAESGMSWKDYALIGAAMSAGVYAANKLRSNTARKIVEGSEKFGLNAPEKTEFGAGKQFLEGAFDKDEPIVSTLRGAGFDSGADFVDMSRPGGSLEARMRAVTGTGKIAGWSGTLPKLRDEMSRIAVLDPKKRELLYEGIRAGDKLSMYTKDPARYSLGNENVEDLLSKVNAIERDTGEIGQLARSYRDIARGLARYRYDMGLIDQDTLHQWLRQENWYMPRFAQDEGGFIRRNMQRLVKRSGYLQSPTDTRLKYAEVPDDVKLLDPYHAMEQYMHDTIRAVDDNETRRYIVQAVQKSKPDWIREAKKGDTDTFDVVTDGVKKSYFAEDPVLRRALKSNPQQGGVLLNGARFFNELYTTGTTGWLNPLQSIRALVYDSLSAVGTAPREARYTPTVAGLDLGLVPGVGQALALGQGTIGAMALLRANLARNFSNIFRDMANKGGVLAPMADTLAVSLGKSFENSTLDMMERYGAVSARYMHADQVVSDFRTVMREMAPAFATNIPKLAYTFNVYHGILDSLQNGARAFYFMKHGKQPMKGTNPYFDMLKVAKNTRQLTGDFGKSGGSAVNTALRAGIPYWNPSLQSFRSLGKAAKDDPVHFGMWATSTVATMAGAAYLMMNASPEHADWFRNELSMSDRNRFIWMPKVSFTADGEEVLGPPEQSWAIPVPPEMQIFNSGAVSFMEAMHDTLQTEDPSMQLAWEALGETLGSGKFHSQLGEAAMQTLPFSLPSAATQALSLGNMKVPLGRFTASPVYESPYEDGMLSPTMQNIASSFFGTFGATVAKALDEGSLHGSLAKGQVDEFFGAGLDSILEDAGHYTPTLAPLWGHNRKLTGGTYDAKVFKDQNSAIERIQGTIPHIKDFYSQTMGTGVGQGPLLSAKPPLTQMDEGIVKAFLFVDETSRKLDQFKQTINSDRDRISAIQNDRRLSPEQKAHQTTQLMRRIAGMQRFLTKAYSTVLEDPLTQVFGRKITLEELANFSQMSNPK